VVINAVGLTAKLGGEIRRGLGRFARGEMANVGAVIPAVTCSVQSTYLDWNLAVAAWDRGQWLYFRDECEIKFWKQSNKLFMAEIWDRAKEKDAKFTCANLFCGTTCTPAPIVGQPRPM